MRSPGIGRQPGDAVPADLRLRAKRTVSSVEPRSRGRRKNAFVLDRKREKLISEAIRETYLKPERPTMTYLIEQVRARCERAELPGGRTGGRSKRGLTG